MQSADRRRGGLKISDNIRVPLKFYLAALEGLTSGGRKAAFRFRALFPFNQGTYFCTMKKNLGW